MNGHKLVSNARGSIEWSSILLPSVLDSRTLVRQALLKSVGGNTFEGSIPSLSVMVESYPTIPTSSSRKAKREQ